MGKRRNRSGKATANRPIKKSLSCTESLRVGFLSWHKNKSPVLNYALKFSGLTLCFFALSLIPGWDSFLSSWMNENARLSGTLLLWLGEKCHISGAIIGSTAYGVTVEPGCSAFEFAAFYCAAVLAFQTDVRRKILGIICGLFILFSVNLIRITSLYWIRVHIPACFDTVHAGIWPSLLIVITMLVFIGWLEWDAENHETRAI